jgi:protein-S-isoprenylcysteine O-methyltransferase Ste14
VGCEDLTVVDVYLSRSSTLVRSLVWSVAMTAWLRVAEAIDLFGWYDEDDGPTSVVGFLLRFVVGVVIFLVVILAFQYGRVRKEREAVGPRFDTDREALRHALVTNELPTDESLDEALLTAVVRRRRSHAHDDDIVARVVIAVIALVFAVGLARSEAPWLALVLVPLVVIGFLPRRRQAQKARQLDDLEADLRARLGAQPASGRLTYGDLRA